MCVRYTLHKTDAALTAISSALGVPLDTPDWVGPKFNISLTDTSPVVALGAGGAGVRPMRWGLIPQAERGLARPRLLANARSETVATMPAFRKPVAVRRGLVPANGFYEWLDSGGVKLPHLFTLTDEEPFAFAGIWDPADETFPETYCILTTRPNGLVAKIHDRMPVILTAETMPRWIGDNVLSTEELTDLVRPLDAARMQSRPVSRFMSNSRNEGPRCLEPPDASPPEMELDFG
jgi:putative SOS response-associated peptidase YedK